MQERFTKGTKAALSYAKQIAKDLEQEDYVKSIKKLVPHDAEEYKRLQTIFSGGYTHANRHLSGWTIEEDIKAYDFSSSYPFCMLTTKMPCERFWPSRTVTEEDIIKKSKV